MLPRWVGLVFLRLHRSLLSRSRKARSYRSKVLNSTTKAEPVTYLDRQAIRIVDTGPPDLKTMPAV